MHSNIITCQWGLSLDFSGPAMQGSFGPSGPKWQKESQMSSQCLGPKRPNESPKHGRMRVNINSFRLSSLFCDSILDLLGPRGREAPGTHFGLLLPLWAWRAFRTCECSFSNCTDRDASSYRGYFFWRLTILCKMNVAGSCSLGSECGNFKYSDISSLLRTVIGPSQPHVDSPYFIKESRRSWGSCGLEILRSSCYLQAAILTFGSIILL